jgi:hypothetical protein
MIKTVLCVIFRLSVAAFLFGGAAIVVLQTVGLATGNGDLVTAVTDNLAPWVYGSAGVAGLLAFVLSYFPQREEAPAMTTVGTENSTAASELHEHA